MREQQEASELHFGSSVAGGSCWLAASRLKANVSVVK